MEGGERIITRGGIIETKIGGSFSHSGVLLSNAVMFPTRGAGPAYRVGGPREDLPRGELPFNQPLINH